MHSEPLPPKNKPVPLLGPAFLVLALPGRYWLELLKQEINHCPDFRRDDRGDDSPVVIAVNPGSLLGTKMVKEAYGMAGRDARTGAEILCRAALADEFATASGQYFDNDSGQFRAPHHDARDQRKSQEVVRVIETVLAEIRRQIIVRP